MKKLLILNFLTSFLILASAMAWAANTKQTAALDFARSFISGANEIKLYKETKKSYFFLKTVHTFKNSCEAPNDCCINGVVIDKKSNKVINPALDAKMNIHIPYSNTFVNSNFLITNCND